MSIGEQMRAIRQRHGESLRQASQRTGINYSTLQRIEQGDTPRGIMEYVHQFASGFGVDPGVLLDGASLKGRFEGQLRKLCPTKRLELIAAPTACRVKLLLDYVLAAEGVDYLTKVALAAELPRSEVEAAVRMWLAQIPDLQTCVQLSMGLHALTGVSLQWLMHGWVDEEVGIQARLNLYLARIVARSRSGKLPLDQRGVSEMTRAADFGQELRR